MKEHLDYIFVICVPNLITRSITNRLKALKYIPAVLFLLSYRILQETPTSKYPEFCLRSHFLLSHAVSLKSANFFFPKMYLVNTIPLAIYLAIN